MLAVLENGIACFQENLMAWSSREKSLFRETEDWILDDNSDWIPVREDVEPDPPRLFRGYKRIVENPEDYKNFSATVRLYQDIFGVR